MSEKFIRAYNQVMKKFPYFAPIYRRVVIIKTDDIPTAAAAWGYLLLYNEKFFDQLSDNEAMFVVLHEIMHLALNHVMPSRVDNKNRQIWNIATDVFINHILFGDLFNKTVGETIRKGLVSLLAITEHPELLGMHYEEHIYEYLKKKAIENGTGGLNNDILPKGDDIARKYASRRKVIDVDNDAKKLIREIRRTMKNHGSIPETFTKAFDNLEEFIPKWIDELLAIVQQSITTKLTSSMPILIPSGTYDTELGVVYENYIEKITEYYLHIIWDVSGSMHEYSEQIAEFIYGLLSLPGANIRLTLYIVDTDLKKTVHINSPDDFINYAEKAILGGGTSFVSVLKKIEKMPEVDKVIIITDAYADWPATFNKPLIGVFTEDYSSKYPDYIQPVFIMEKRGK